MTPPVCDTARKFCVPFLLWTVTSFLCHKMAKEFLMTAQPGITSHDQMTSSMKCGLALVLTVAQCAVCLMTISPNLDLPLSGICVTMGAHFLATLFTNLSMAFIHAASTFAIKLTEPVTMVIAHRLAFKTPVTIETWTSLPLIIIGALVFTDATLDESTSMGVALAMGSNIVLAARNVSMKLIQENPSTPPDSPVSKPKKVIIFREPKHLILGYGLLGVFVLMYFFIRSQGAETGVPPYVLMCLLGTSVFHVSYSYISTNVILRVMTVVSHSIANIFKRLFVVMLLYAGGHRSASASSWAGLVLAAVGLAIYILPQLKQANRPGGLVVNGGSLLSLLKRTVMGVMGVILCLVTVTTFTSYKALSLQMFDLQAHFQNNQQYSLTLGNGSMFPVIANDSAVFDNQVNKDFLSKNLIDFPTETDFLSKQLRTNQEIIKEAQRVHMNVLKSVIKGARYVMLMEVAIYENKGDPAISVGETLLFQKLNLTMVYYCSTAYCTANAMKRAQKVAKNYKQEDLVIFMQGGGNVVGYKGNDNIRKLVLDAFPDHMKVLFSQSIWLHKNNTASLKNAVKIYSNRTNFLMYCRDRQSLAIARENFKNITPGIMLMPDMAWNIGMRPRQFPPAYDVLWLKRGDTESPRYEIGDSLKNRNFTSWVGDYFNNWKSNKGATDMETSFLVTSNGFQFLQRGRVLITDRLHGHILSSLMNIPHVLFDNPPFYKLSSFHKSWTFNQENVAIVDNKEQAIIEAQKLLKKYDSILPKKAPYMSEKIWEHTNSNTKVNNSKKKKVNG